MFSEPYKWFLNFEVQRYDFLTAIAANINSKLDFTPVISIL
jgi:hypothetical protein